MSTVVFSDSHITSKFDPAKFLYLQKIIEPADRIIINGDFWDGYMTDFTDLLNSEWSKLFEMLNRKETYYVCGNHDAMALKDPRTKQFAKLCTDVLEIVLDEKHYRFEHGHRIVPTMDLRIPWIFQRSWVASTAAKLEGAAAWLFGFNSFKFHMRSNVRMKRWQKKHLPANQILVCGHSHWPELNEPEQYINTGFIRHHYTHHLIIENGQHRLVGGRY